MTNIGRKLQITAAALGFLYAGFVGMFALDTPFGIGFIIHLTPSFIIIIACLIGLRGALAGGIFNAGLAIAFTLFFHSYKALASFLIISVPLIVISALFFVSALILGKDKKS
ncbi:MAG: hypothetical protein ABII64_02925 [Elusimicrobiota bacterium]